MGSYLVTGGAGYIGSHMVWLLSQYGGKVITLDNLSTGHRDAVSYGKFIEGDVGDQAVLDKIFAQEKIDLVFHFASSTSVGESVTAPDLYYRNNFCETLNLLEAMARHNVKRLVFSSTAAVYGVPHSNLIDEGHDKLPINPYGKTKHFTEELIKDFDVAYGVKCIALRYFNAAGAHPDGILAERHDPETHLIPIALRAALESSSKMTINGVDYNTHDGTCIRDYIHVMDLVGAHWLASQKLLSDSVSRVYNVGSGTGYSVRQVLASIEKVTGKKVKYEVGPRRVGDPAFLVACSRKLVDDLGWKPMYSDLDNIVKDAYNSLYSVE